MADAEILVETLPAVGHAQTVEDEVVRPDSHAQTEGEADAGDRVGRRLFPFTYRHAGRCICTVPVCTGVNR
jgi:hypothetical protein